MAWWVPLIAAGAQLIGGQQGQQAAERAGEEEARFIEAETAEQVRRAEREFAFDLGQQQAILGASGVRSTVGTAVMQTRAFRAESERQIEWLRYSGHLRARAARAGARGVGQGALTSGIIGGLSGIGSAVGEYSSLG